jgi:hypothetical protein
MEFQGRGPEVAKQLLDVLKGALEGYAVSAEDAETSGQEWSRTIAVRKGSWVGVDVDLKQESPQSATVVEVDRASKGSTVGILVAVVLAIVLAIASGDPILEALGITSVKTTLTVGLAALGFMFVTVPVAIGVTKLLGRGGAQESEALQSRITALIETARTP